MSRTILTNYHFLEMLFHLIELKAKVCKSQGFEGSIHAMSLARAISGAKEPELQIVTVIVPKYWYFLFKSRNSRPHVLMP